MPPLIPSPGATQTALPAASAKIVAQVTRDAEIAKNRDGQSFDDIFSLGDAQPDADLAAGSNAETPEPDRADAEKIGSDEIGARASAGGKDSLPRTSLSDDAADQNRSTDLVDLPETGLINPDTFPITKQTDLEERPGIKNITSRKANRPDQQISGSGTSLLLGRLEVPANTVGQRGTALGPTTASFTSESPHQAFQENRIAKEVSLVQVDPAEMAKANVVGVYRTTSESDISASVSAIQKGRSTTAAQNSELESTAKDHVARIRGNASHVGRSVPSGGSAYEPTQSTPIRRVSGHLPDNTPKSNTPGLGLDLSKQLLRHSESASAVQAMEGRVVSTAAFSRDMTMEPPVSLNSSQSAATFSDSMSQLQNSTMSPTSAATGRKSADSRSTGLFSIHETSDKKFADRATPTDRTSGDERHQWPRLSNGSATTVPAAAPVAWTGAANVMKPDTDLTDLRSRDLPDLLTRTEAVQTSATQQTHQSSPHRAELPPHIARQLADALPRAQNRPVEITLAPEELGRVRLSVSVSDAGVTVNLLAERPETLDLLRRNIDLLAQDFQALGFEKIAFAFDGDNSESGGESEAQDTESSSLASRDDTNETTVIELRSGASNGLDLRL